MQYSVGILTLGCKVNTCESEQIREKLAEAGFRIVDFEDRADIYVINTCSVTNIADRKSRQMLHRARKNNPDAVIAATGCYAQINGEKVLESEDADVVIGNNHKSEIADILIDFIEKRSESKMSYNDFSTVRVDKIEEERCFESMELTEFPEKSRAFIKIEDGCNQFCSYCIIPYARGRVRSRDSESIVREATELSKGGIHEVVLTGIHLSSYGQKNYEAGIKRKSDEAEFTYGPLLELIEKISLIDGIERIRLGSLEPRIITFEFAEKLKQINKFCPHFHLALQSGSDSVLKRMNRHYDTKEFYDKCEILRNVFDNPAITTDIITGFPGETDAEFEESLAFYRKVNFAKMHIFKFSRRGGTAADRMPGQVTENIKHERSVLVEKIDEQNHHEYMKSFVGSVQDILIEEYENGFYKGLNSRYVPVMIPEAEFATEEYAAGVNTAENTGEVNAAKKTIDVNTVEKNAADENTNAANSAEKNAADENTDAANSADEKTSDEKKFNAADCDICLEKGTEAGDDCVWKNRIEKECLINRIVKVRIKGFFDDGNLLGTLITND